jgi:hypothetical protein
LPVVLGLILNYLRPDVIEVVLESPIGRIPLFVAGLVAIFDAVVKVVGSALINIKVGADARRRRKWVIALASLSWLLLTLPVTAMVLFWPIVTIFMLQGD